MYAALGLLKGEEIKININQQSTAFKHLINFFKKT
jgi:3-methyl-2-oxobutanoate hydroxymethyltransferase